MAMGSGFLRRLGRNPGYGLRRTKKSYKRDGQPPAGPRLVSLKRLFRRPYSERAHERRLNRARILLLALGGLVLTFGLLRFVVVKDDAATICAVVGALFLGLHALSRVSPPAALWASVLAFAAFAAPAWLAIATYGEDHPGLYVIQSPVSVAVLMAMIVVLLSLISGARSAVVLAKVRADRPTPD